MQFDANVVNYTGVPTGNRKAGILNAEEAYVDLHRLSRARIFNEYKYFLDLKPGKKQLVNYKVTYSNAPKQWPPNTERKREPCK